MSPEELLLALAATKARMDECYTKSVAALRASGPMVAAAAK